MMGPLHIEMALLNAIGDRLEGSGWPGLFDKAKISTPGRVDSFLSGSHVKRSRYAHLNRSVYLPFAQWHKKYFKNLVAARMKIGKTS